MPEAIAPFFWVIVLIFSVIIHEVSHGLLALHLGDDTAKRAGRLTLNPMKHLDPVGSFLVPLGLYVLTMGQFMFGWARPVPYDPRFLKNPKAAEGMIAAAGPMSNLLLAILFAGIAKLLFAAQAPLPATFGEFINIIIFVNILLGVFNAVPIPPLDGSKILFSLLPDSMRGIRAWMEHYGMILLIAFLFIGLPIIGPIIYGLFSFLAR